LRVKERSKMNLIRTFRVISVVTAAAIMTGAVLFMENRIQPVTAADSAAGSENPLTRKWAGRFGGVPAFDRVKIADFKPALEEAMAENLKEIDAIAKNRAVPTFANTIAAMERAGSKMDRVATVYYIWSANMKNAEFSAVEREMAPKLAAFSDKITQNEALFKRIEAVYSSPKLKDLSSEQQRLSWVYFNNFVRAGARLKPEEKSRLSEINQSLAGLFTRFNQNLLKDENDQYVELRDEADLAGMSQSYKDAAAADASAKGVKDAWIIRNTRSSVDPFLTYAERRDLREKVWRMFIMRGDGGGETDNKQIIAEILQLRAERAKLLGHETHAHWRLENAMAKTPERAMELLEAVWTPAVDRVMKEVRDMQALADKQGSEITIEPWDYRFYMEKVRKDRYDLDANEVKQYLQLDKIRDAMFWVAGELFDFSFTPVTSRVPVFHPDVTVWEVKRKSTGKHVGLWYFDPYARDGKRSGAWMNAYRRQSRFNGEVATIVSNNSNFVKGQAGKPVLISWDDALTMFHEFGHALHGLSSNVTYPSLSGTAVARDYVEFPSQLLEHWLSTPEVLQNYAVHFETGKPIPQSLVDKIEKAATFNQGFATTEYLSSALIDMKLHLAGSQKIDVARFEKETLDKLGMPRELVMRHRTPQFAHAFGSDGYSAGYYSYLWSDVITADAFGAFTEGKGPYDKAVGKRLVDHIFSVGNTIDPADAYRLFRGRDPKVEALMIKRGFVEPPGK
jgi:peptidyl-dipeptidase Dcp